MKTFFNNFNFTKNINFLIKIILLFTIISITNSYPSISTYTSYERYISDTLQKFSTAATQINFIGMDLSTYNIIINNKDEKNISRKGVLSNFKASNPIFKKEDFFGKMIKNTIVFLNNLEKNDTFQMDLY